MPIPVWDIYLGALDLYFGASCLEAQLLDQAYHEVEVLVLGRAYLVEVLALDRAFLVADKSTIKKLKNFGYS